MRGDFMKKISEHFSGINPFHLEVSYVEMDPTQVVFESHAHEECEIYMNLSGDVSFVVENRIYPVPPGGMIITRPFEYHHCVHNSSKLHKHFWILFSAAGNEELFDVFYKRRKGEGNLLTLPPKETEMIISLFHKMVEGAAPQSQKYYRFFRMITLLQSADVADADEDTYPADIVYAINYISRHFAEPISVGEIAKGANVSINTLERHFSQILHLSPSAYIRKKRLAHAAKLLTEGSSVTEASDGSGFSDYSNFIALFKRTYGVTPLVYKKQQR